MANEKRLIDANALLQVIRMSYERMDSFVPDAERRHMAKAALLSTLDLIGEVPTVDAVELPCRIGDSVWGIRKHNRGKEVKQGTVSQMLFVEDMKLCLCVKNVCRGEWGKNVFATKEEAEAALEKMDGDGNA